MTRPRGPRGRRDPKGIRPAREWIGGRFSPPVFIEDEGAPFRAELAIWIELPSGLIVGMKFLRPDETPGALSTLLRASMERPAAGPPRRPDRIRVSEAAMAAEVRAAIGDAIPIETAPTPELDLVLRQLVESMPGEDVVESYLEGGRIAAETVQEMFRASELLYRLAPWKHAADHQVLRMDIPALGVEGACVSIVGALGQARGVLVFPSLAGYEAFGAAGEAAVSGKRPLDMGTKWLSLCFDRKVDVPPSMRREVKHHGWSVAGPDAYPRVTRHDPDGASRPLLERDLKIAAACATSLSAFFVKHSQLFESGDGLPVCESFFDDDDLEVRFTAPYEAFGLFDVGAESRPQAARRGVASGHAKVGRNDPCPCGSGRKYKKCHGAGGSSPRSTASDGDPHHVLDARWVDRLGTFARHRFGREWTAFEEQFADASQVPSLAVPWSVYGFPVRGATVLEWYLAEHEQNPSPEDRDWLMAQRAAWLSIWEVTEVEPGASVMLRDLLTGERRHVREVSGSQTLVVHDTLLARVVDLSRASLLCGVHPRPLPPIDGAEVVGRCRGRLRLKLRPAPVERVRESSFARYLIRCWDEAVARLDARAAMPPVLQNTDGDPFLLTTDHYEIESGARSEVEARLAALEDVQSHELERRAVRLVFVRPDPEARADSERTIVGVVRIQGDALRAETTSTARAHALRARIEAACGGRLRHRAREHTDPLSQRVRRTERRQESPLEQPPPEMIPALLDLKRRHFATWMDESIPALGGRTPREAVRTASGRAAVDVLLKDIENRERRFPDGVEFDFAEVRRILRLDG